VVQDSCHGTGVDKFCLSQSFFVCQNCKEIACLLACLLAGWPAGWLACQSSPWTWQWRLIGLHESNSAELYGVLIGGFCIIVLVFLFSCCCSTSNHPKQHLVLIEGNVFWVEICQSCKKKTTKCLEMWQIPSTTQSFIFFNSSLIYNKDRELLTEYYLIFFCWGLNFWGSFCIKRTHWNF
jgi:hypothetical protein